MGRKPTPESGCGKAAKAGTVSQMEQQSPVRLRLAGDGGVPGRPKKARSSGQIPNCQNSELGGRKAGHRCSICATPKRSAHFKQRSQVTRFKLLFTVHAAPPVLTFAADIHSAKALVLLSTATTHGLTT